MIMPGTTRGPRDQVPRAETTTPSLTLPAVSIGDLVRGPLATRGTTNGNARGGSEARRRRREWLVATYRADVDMPDWHAELHGMASVPLGAGVMACRCYRCGVLLMADTVTVDRIKPGCRGGTYRRDNIRPACGPCNSETGGAVRGIPRGKR